MCGETVRVTHMAVASSQVQILPVNWNVKTLTNIVSKFFETLYRTPDERDYNENEELQVCFVPISLC